MHDLFAVYAALQSEIPIDISTLFVCYLSPAPGTIPGVTLPLTQLEMGYVT